jgi:hypothetical protein
MVFREVRAEDFTYRIDNGTVTITGYSGAGGNVNIPSSINGLPVTVIDNYAFLNITSLTSLTIPDSVTGIGVWTFGGCTELNSLKLGSNVVFIGYAAFSGSRLTIVVIPKSVTTIGASAFAGGSLMAIVVDTLSPSYAASDGVLFDKDLKTLIQYPGGKAGAYSIPNTVTNVGPWAFSYCPSLTDISIPESVSTISESAFSGCTNLSNLTISKGVGTIGDSAFTGCTSLTNVSIPNSVTNMGTDVFASCTSLGDSALPDSLSSIGDGLFEGCTSLSSVNIPNSVALIGDSAFSGCTSLTNVSIPNGTTYVGIYSFMGCASLERIAIPSSVTNIGSLAFGECTALKAILVDVLNPTYSSVDGILFDRSQKTLIRYPPGKVGNYTIPYGTTRVETFAFADASSLSSVILPSTVVSLGYGSFSSSTSLTALYFLGKAPSIEPSPFGESLFAYDSKVKSVYYLPGTTGWGPTFGGVPIAVGTIVWSLPNPVILNGGTAFGANPGGFAFIISWATNTSVVIEACTALDNSNWIPLSTNTLIDGTVSFTDPEWANYRSRFYRVRSP